MNATELITLRHYENAISAQLDADLLKTENIDSYIVNGELVSMLWHLSIAVGGVQLKVKTADAERASQLLQDHPQPKRPGVVGLYSLNARVKRSVKSAVIGMFIPFVTLYSLWLVGDLIGEADQLTARQKMLLGLAGGINVSVLTILYLLFMY